MKFLQRIAFVLFVFVLSSNSLFGQRLAVKSNAVAWCTASPNIAGEFLLSDHISLNVDITGNPWDFNKNKWQFLKLQPEVRYWFGRPMSEFFVGATAFAITYDMSIKNNRRIGDGLGAGISCGYAHIINARFNIEASIGIGAMGYRQLMYPKGDKVPLSINSTGVVAVPAQLSISFVYIIN